MIYDMNATNNPSNPFNNPHAAMGGFPRATLVADQATPVTPGVVVTVVTDAVDLTGDNDTIDGMKTSNNKKDALPSYCNGAIPALFGTYKVLNPKTNKPEIRDMPVTEMWRKYSRMTISSFVRCGKEAQGVTLKTQSMFAGYPDETARAFVWLVKTILTKAGVWVFESTITKSVGGVAETEKICQGVIERFKYITELYACEEEYGIFNVLQNLRNELIARGYACLPEVMSAETIKAKLAGGSFVNFKKTATTPDDGASANVSGGQVALIAYFLLNFFKHVVDTHKVADFGMDEDEDDEDEEADDMDDNTPLTELLIWLAKRTVKGLNKAPEKVPGEKRKRTNKHCTKEENEARKAAKKAAREAAKAENKEKNKLVQSEKGKERWAKIHAQAAKIEESEKTVAALRATIEELEGEVANSSEAMDAMDQYIGSLQTANQALTNEKTKLLEMINENNEDYVKELERVQGLLSAKTEELVQVEELTQEWFTGGSIAETIKALVLKLKTTEDHYRRFKEAVGPLGVKPDANVGAIAAASVMVTQGVEAIVQKADGAAEQADGAIAASRAASKQASKQASKVNDTFQAAPPIPVDEVLGQAAAQLEQGRAAKRARRNGRK